MTDVFDKEKRSKIMSAVKGKNTAVEVMVFRYLRHHHIYFQKHYKRAIGNPDIALPRKKRAVFIDGDFWHGREIHKLLKRPDANENTFWINKIRANIARDEFNRNSLVRDGWRVLAIWESDLRRKSTRSDELLKVKEFLTSL